MRLHNGKARRRHMHEQKDQQSFQMPARLESDTFEAGTPANLTAEPELRLTCQDDLVSYQARLSAAHKISIQLNQLEKGERLSSYLEHCEKVEHLEISIIQWEYWAVLDLIHFLEKANTLKNLVIKIDFKDFAIGPTRKQFLSVFKKCSSLVYIKVISKTLTRDELQLVSRALNLGKLKRNLAKEIEELVAESVGKDYSNEALVRLAKWYGKIWAISIEDTNKENNFIEALETSEEGKQLVRRAKKYHLIELVRDEALFNQLQPLLFSCYSVEERNQVFYPYLGNSPERAMGQATPLSVKKTLWLKYQVSPLADPLFAKNKDARSGGVYGNINNLLLQNEGDDFLNWPASELKKIKVPHGSVSCMQLVLEAGCVLVQYQKSDQDKYFGKFFTEYSEWLAPNQPLDSILYRGYTFIQVCCLHWHHTFARRYILSYIESLPSDQRLMALNSYFPDNDQTISTFTVLHYLTYHHCHSLLSALVGELALSTQDIVLKTKTRMSSRFSDMSLAQAYFLGLVDHQEKHDETLNRELEDAKKVHQLLDQIEDGKVLEGCQINEEEEYLPIAHFLLLKLKSKFLDEIIAEYFFDSWELGECVDYASYKALSPFSFFLLYGELTQSPHTCKKFIQHISGLSEEKRNAMLERQLEEVAHPPAKAYYKGCCVYQVLALQDRCNNLAEDVFRQLGLIDRPDVVNRPLPDTFAFPGWRLLQVFIWQLQGGDNNGFCRFLLSSQATNVKILYPEGTPFQDLSILQALIVAGFSSGLPYIEEIELSLDRMPADRINRTCQHRDSEFFGKTALHLVVEKYSPVLVDVLLQNEKVDYTVKDWLLKSPMDYASFYSNGPCKAALERAGMQRPRLNQAFLSEVSPSLNVTREDWRVAIVRDHDNPNHVFLVIEMVLAASEGVGLSRKTCLAELYLPSAHGSFFGMAGRAIVFFNEACETIEPGHSRRKNLLPILSGKVVPLTEGMMLFYRIARVANQKTCQDILEKLEEACREKRPYNYFITGSSSNSTSTTNCVRFAKTLFNELVSEEDKLPESWIDSIVTTARAFLNKDFIYMPFSNKDLFREKVAGLVKKQERLATTVTRQHQSQGWLWAIIFLVGSNQLLSQMELVPTFGVLCLSVSIAAGVKFIHSYLSPGPTV